MKYHYGYASKVNYFEHNNVNLNEKISSSHPLTIISWSGEWLVLQKLRICIQNSDNCDSLIHVIVYPDRLLHYQLVEQIMNNNESKDELRFPILRKLYPDWSTEELTDADNSLGSYLDIVIKIYKRTEREKYERMGKKYPLDLDLDL